MKVQVNLKIASQGEANSKFDLTVNAEDTVESVKERIAASQLIAFPDQDLMLEGDVLENRKTMADCGVKDASSLDFVIQASEKSLVLQLKELLQARDLSSDELGLLYCYKHGVSINQALKTVGHTEKFQDFIKKQKEFLAENGRVSLIRNDTALKPFSVAEEVKHILEETSSGSMDITSLCSKFTQKFNVSISSVANMRPTEFLEKEKDLFVVTGRGQVTLKSAFQGQQKQKKEQPRVPRQQPETPTQPSMKSHAESESPAAKVSSEASNSEEYLELHNKISGRSFNSKVAQTLNDIVDVVTEKSFLNIAQVVKGGSIGKGTAISGSTDAEVVFFLKGLPPVQHTQWLPALLKAVAGVLTQHLDTGYGVEGICTTADSVHMKVKGLVEVDLRFSPAFESYAEAIQALGEQSPDARKHCSTSLLKEKVQFIAKQPGQVKVTMRLLKWWRGRRQWSSAVTRPSDQLLELTAAYVAGQSKPRDQETAVADALSLLAKFRELRITWPGALCCYSSDDVPEALLQQRPLIMGPADPFANIADPQAFDPRELVAHAQSTGFFE